MYLRKRIQLPDGLGSAVVILCADDGVQVAGKFIAGVAPEDPGTPVVAFDAGCAFHKDVGTKYGLRPLGGGWCEISHTRREIWLSGRSTQYGRERDRRHTLAAFRAALPDYRIEEEPG